MRQDEIRATGGVASLGTPRARVDGPAKVCGTADFPGDTSFPDMAYAVLVRSAVARGRIASIDAAGARAAGAIDVLTHEQLSNQVRHLEHFLRGGYVNSTLRPLAGPDIAHAGQIVAVVVADSREAAQEAAGRVRITYEREAAHASLDDPAEAPVPLASVSALHKDRSLGDVAAGLAAAAAVVDERYATPIQHHNAMELPDSICRWDGDDLTLFEPTRAITAAQFGLAGQLGIAPERVRVVARFIGGHFGSKLALSQHSVLCALAARRVGRPVRLIVSRRDGFTVANHRTETRHRIRLGADADGRFTALSHEGETATSRFDDFAMEGTDVTTALYACPNIHAEERLARVDRNTPGPMRAPPEVPYVFALESAVDELACRLGMDPIELRRRNDTPVDPVTGHPFTTRALMPCFDVGAAAFGWAGRDATPRARLRDGWWEGMGCAAAARPMKIGAATLRLTLGDDGAVLVETAHHEIGNGLYTVLATMASERLGVPMARITVRLGDTRLPPALVSGGSATTTTMLAALAEACRRLGGRPGSVEVGFVPPGAPDGALDAIRQGKGALTGAADGRLAWSFGAQFAAVRVDAVTGEVRVARLLGAFAAGRIVNPLTARSQLIGGMIWGLSSALLEETVVDPRTGGYVNGDLGEYLVPVSADVGAIEAITVEDVDPQANAEGVKGVGEIGIIGVNAAIGNAIYNATGRRVRRLPVRLDDLA